MAIKIGITGGIGSGKSLVSRLLEVMGIPVYISDIESKRLTNSDALIRRELIALLGEEVYAGDELNKPLLASYIFGDPEHIRTVNSIIHPRVRDDFRQWDRASYYLSGSRHGVCNSDRSRICRRSRCCGSGLCARRTSYHACHAA